MLFNDFLVIFVEHVGCSSSKKSACAILSQPRCLKLNINIYCFLGYRNHHQMLTRLHRVLYDQFVFSKVTCTVVLPHLKNHNDVYMDILHKKFSFCSSIEVFTESDVHRTSSSTPSNSGDNNIDYSFYVNYPDQSIPMVQNILASVVKFELQAIQLESALTFSLETSFSPSPPTQPTSDQSNNIVEIRILNQQVSEVWKLCNMR